jgi:hypothetical protein
MPSGCLAAEEMKMKIPIITVPTTHVKPKVDTTKSALGLSLG